MDSMRNGRSRITDGIIRNPGRAEPATIDSRPKPFQIHFSARNSCPFSTRIVMSNARSNTECSFSCLFSRHSFCSKRTARQKIHPFQYLMVGAALCLFYLLLLSISEFIDFSWAYLIAAVASIALITWYCRFFLGGGVRTFMIGAGLTGVYTFLYITLRQQDYALLMGAIALFIVLAIVMYVTRRVAW